jgi:hypothetical protein
MLELPEAKAPLDLIWIALQQEQGVQEVIVPEVLGL